MLEQENSYDVQLGFMNRLTVYLFATALVVIGVNKLTGYNFTKFLLIVSAIILILIELAYNYIQLNYSYHLNESCIKELDFRNKLKSTIYYNNIVDIYTLNENSNIETVVITYRDESNQIRTAEIKQVSKEMMLKEWLNDRR